MDTQINNAFNQTINPNFYNYFNNECTDPRVDAMNLGISDPEYQEYCQMYAMDFSQIFDTFNCNKWLCNLNGFCVKAFNNDGSVNQSCTCNDGGWDLFVCFLQ